MKKMTLYIHQENTARYDAFIKLLDQSLSTQYKIINEKNELDIKDDDILIILGENDIAKYGYKHYSKKFKSSQCVFPLPKQFQLESSKLFCRKYIENTPYKIINPIYNVINKHTDLDTIDFTNKVIKADGLSSGKGVFVFDDHFKNNLEAYHIITELFQLYENIVIEEKLQGYEFSLISLCWKNIITHFPIVKDFKRLYNGDIGSNTGGMGTISFPNGSMPFLTNDDLIFCQNINSYICNDLNYQGFLYGSFMKTLNGDIKLIEYNCRLGDSEAVNICSTIESEIGLHFLQPEEHPLEINTNKYTYFRYCVPKGYPNLFNNLTNPYFSYCKYDIPTQNIYFANCHLVYCLPNNVLIYEMNRSRAFGIFTQGTKLKSVIDKNNLYISKIFGDIHYRTDLDLYFTKKYNTQHNYLNHLNNYNHIINNIKQFIDQENNIIINNKPSLKLIGKIGDFANSIQYNQYKLICSVDGAGTKTKFLENNVNRFFILGQDVVIHNINDMICNQGTPIAFLDYYGCDTLNKEEFSQFIKGVMYECKKYNIPLIGGETAEMKGIFIKNEIEVLGILLGIVENGLENKNGLDIKEGNYIYGIKSDGAHTNGFTKLRQIETQINQLPENVKKYFSRPHKCYSDIVKCLDNDLEKHIKGLAHITGGGFDDNISRIFPKQELKLDLINWKENMDEEWKYIFQYSNLTWEEFIKVFNAGYGFCFITDIELSQNYLNKFNDNINYLGKIIS